MADADVIVAGAGLWGATVARRLADAGRRVLVLERRAAVGGNCRAATDAATGIEVHVYGSHIFHTDNEEVWRFVTRFTDFNGYRHRVIARRDGRDYPLPIGLPLLRAFFGRGFTAEEAETFLAAPANRDALFDAFVRGYTAKQWGVPPESVDPSVIRRLRVRFDDDTSYFTDRWQGIPTEGYGRFFARLLDHPDIEVRCGAAFSLDQADGRPVYYSGPLDALFGFRYGPLPWRSLRFEAERVAVRDFQGTAVVNYPEMGIPYTRIHEFKHYHPEWQEAMRCSETIVMREFPATWHPGDEPYYPVSTPEAEALLAKYREAADAVPGLVVGGRLGSFRYDDMDDTVAAALEVTR